MIFDQPLCPKCGCPPRFVLSRRLVKEWVQIDPKTGEAKSMAFTLIPLTKKEKAEASGGGTATLECGLGHKWESSF